MNSPLRPSLAREPATATSPYASALPRARGRANSMALQKSAPGPKFANCLLAISRGLVNVGHLAEGALEHLEGEGVGHLPGIEPDPVLVIDLVIEKVAHGADFAGKAQASAQHAGPGKGAAVAEFGKFQRDQRKVADIVAQYFGVFRCLQPDADGRVARQQALALLLEARQRH